MLILVDVYQISNIGGISLLPLYPYCAYHTKKEMHSRVYTYNSFNSDLLWFNFVHYSSLFQYFFWPTMVLTLVENS